MLLHSQPVTDDYNRRPIHSHIKISCQLLTISHCGWLTWWVSLFKPYPILFSAPCLLHQQHPSSTTSHSQYTYPAANQPWARVATQGDTSGTAARPEVTTYSVTIYKCLAGNHHQGRWLLRTRARWQEGDMEALFCVVFAVATAVGYSKGQTSNLRPNASIDVLKLSPNNIVRFSLLPFCTTAELTSL